MTIPTIRMDDYGIIVTDTDGERVYISAEDALNLRDQITARQPLLEAIIARKKVGTRNNEVHKIEILDTEHPA